MMAQYVFSAFFPGVAVMRRLIRYFSVLAFAPALFAQEEASETAPGAVSRAPRVLLAYESTRFKDGLIEKMKALLEKENVAFDLVDHAEGGLKSIDASEYRAIFITSSGVKSQIRPWIVEWIGKNDAYQGKMLLHVTQTRDWKPETPVDAVTSASARKETDNLASDYTARLRKIYATSDTSAAPAE